MIVPTSITNRKYLFINKYLSYEEKEQFIARMDKLI